MPQTHYNIVNMKNLSNTDPTIYQEIKNELDRQKSGLIMIPSENFTSPAILEAMGTVLNNKYAEGYSQARYYTGNQYIDEIETMAVDRAKKLFKAENANVQPHSGTTANLAAYFSILKPGDKILSMNLSCGGHLSHGAKVSITGKLFKPVCYTVNKKDGLINYDEIREIAKKEKPQLIISGATAYPRQINFETFGQIAKDIGAYHLADISHIAGLIVAGEHPDAVPFADIVTTTTHKTMRGPRSAIILSKNDNAKAINSSIFPGTQGGPLGQMIAAKAVCFQEAMTDKFINDQKQTIKNAKALAKILLDNDINLITGGTDNHLILIDCTPLKITGKNAALALEETGIYTNFNTIPFDPRPANDPSGLRIGTPALTTQGMKESEMKLIGQTIADILKNPKDNVIKNKAKELVQELTQKFPIYNNLEY
jgi:glycine hydroxymethyltransferase